MVFDGIMNEIAMNYILTIYVIHVYLGLFYDNKGLEEIDIFGVFMKRKNQI